jgi:hypothetical protein
VGNMRALLRSHVAGLGGVRPGAVRRSLGVKPLRFPLWVLFPIGHPNNGVPMMCCPQTNRRVSIPTLRGMVYD